MKPKISFAITTHNEGHYVRTLLNQLVSFCDETGNEVVVLDDHSTDEETIDALQWARTSKMFQLGYRRLKSAVHVTSFAEHKNYLNSLCGGEYIFQIDADERLHDVLLESVVPLVEMNPTIDLFLVPRVNTVDGLTDEDVRRWGWRVNERGWVMYPDYQTRLYRNHPNIRWEGKVHERITGFKTMSSLPAEEEWSIIHEKDIERQRKQNDFYNTI